MPSFEDFALPLAGDWMVDAPFVLRPDDELFEALDLLVKHSLSAAPVVDEEGHLVAMLTEKDCLRVVSNVAYGGDVAEGRVADFQSAVRVVIEPGTDLFRVAEQFLATNFPILPVVEEGRLAGLISRQAMLRGIQALRAELHKQMSRFEAGAGQQSDRPRSIEGMQRAFASARSRDQLVRLIGRKR